MAQVRTERKLYPLTPSQGLTLMNRQYCIHRNVVNIPTSIVLDAELDVPLLENAVRLAVGRWDSFGIRVTRKDGQWLQYFAEPALAGLERKDFRGKSVAAMESFCHAQGARVMPLADRPLAKAWILTDPDGRSGVFTVINHLIMDSWAISNFYRDVMEVYQALESGRALPKAPAPYEPVLVKELAYPDSGRRQEDEAYWRRELTETEPLFTSLKGSSVLAAHRRRKRSPDLRINRTFYLRSKAAQVVKVVPSEDVARLQQFLADHRFPSLQLLFLLALRVYLSKVNDRTSDVTIRATLSRRGTLEEKRTGGSRVQSISFRSDLAETMTVTEALDALLDKQNQHYRHVEFPSDETVMMPIKAFGHKPGNDYIGLLFTFQTLAVSLADGLTFRTRWYCNGATAMAAYLTVMDDDGSGGLRCYWERSVSQLSVADIEAAHEAMLRVLRAVVERPEATLGELMDLV